MKTHLFSVLGIASFLVSGPAIAGDVDLFRIYKAIKPENVIMLQANVSSDCKVSGIDFMYLINVDPNTGDPQSTRRLSSMAEGEFRKRFTLGTPSAGNAGACAANSKGCSAISVSSLEFNWVQNGLKDPSIILKAQQERGVCVTKAYIDLNGTAVALKSVKVNADNIHYGLFGATFHVISLDVVPEDYHPLTWKCVNDCDKSEGL